MDGQDEGDEEMTIVAVEEAIGHIKAQLANLPEGKKWPINEWPTRYILIDPMLLALGWDIHDYNQCEVEAPMPSGQWTRTADYVLYDQDVSPRVVIEAKCLGDDLSNPSSVEQLAGYAQELRRGFGVLTNGTEWHLYRLNQADDFTRKRVIRVNLLDGDRRERAKKIHGLLGRGPLLNSF